MTPAELVARRESLGLGQSALARRLGISVVTVWRWEHGDHKPPPWLELALNWIAHERAHA